MALASLNVVTTRVWLGRASCCALFPAGHVAGKGEQVHLERGPAPWLSYEGKWGSTVEAPALQEWFARAENPVSRSWLAQASLLDLAAHVGVLYG